MTDENQNALEANDDLVADKAEATTDESTEKAVEAEDQGPSEEELAAQAAAEEERQAKKRERRQRARKERREKAAAYDQIKSAAAGVEPNEADFEDYNEYVAAKAVYTYRKADTQAKVEAAKAEAEAAAETDKSVVDEDWREQVMMAKADMPDFEQVAFSAPISDEVADLIMTSDMGTKVAYHLGQNHAEARRISQMTPVEAARELGRLEAKLSAPPPKPKTTKAPPPIDPVQGGAGGVDPEKMDFRAYEKYRMGGG